MNTSVLLLGERSVAQLRTGSHQLPEQVSTDPRLGRALHQGQGAHQQRDCHEALAVLQGKEHVNVYCSIDICCGKNSTIGHLTACIQIIL